jgi:RecB family exonuclease
MDRILKNHFDSFRDRGLLPPELRKLKDVKLFDNVKLLEVWRNNRKGVEWIDEDGNVLRGAVDNILQKGDKLIVLDFKTRGFPLKEDTHKNYQDQLDIYNFLLRKNGFDTEDYAYLLFYHPKEVEEDGDVAFNTDLVKVDISIENAERIFMDAIEILKGEMPDCGEECEFCKWRNEE